MLPGLLFFWVEDDCKEKTFQWTPGPVGGGGNFMPFWSSPHLRISSEEQLLHVDAPQTLQQYWPHIESLCVLQGKL